jgi:hypothetical protein
MKIITRKHTKERLHANRANFAATDCCFIGCPTVWHTLPLDWTTMGYWRNSGRPGTGTIVPGCSLLWPSLQVAVFPVNALPTLQVLGDIGLILYMFSLGARLDTNMMLRQSRKALPQQAFFSHCFWVVSWLSFRSQLRFSHCTFLCFEEKD